MLSGTSFTEESIETVVASPNCFVWWHLTIRLNAMFQAIQLPTGIADLDSSLANVDWDTFTLKKRTSILPSTDFVRNFTYISRETINHSYLGRKQTSYYRYLTENTQKDQVIWSIDRVSKNDAHFPPPHARRQKRNITFPHSGISTYFLQLIPFPKKHNIWPEI